MELCQTCPKNASNNCHQLCPNIQDYLKGKRNYKTTYVNKEVGLNEVHENRAYVNLGDYLDTSGSFTEKFGHLLPTIEQIVKAHGTDRQKQIYSMWVTEKMSLLYISQELHQKPQSVHEVMFGHRGQGGLVRKIRKHLAKLPEASFIS